VGESGREKEREQMREGGVGIKREGGVGIKEGRRGGNKEGHLWEALPFFQQNNE
jgi:hypothetical protein